MSDEQQPGFLIDGVFYPAPKSFRLGDPVLVREVTGLEWDEFDARYKDAYEAVEAKEEATDPLVVLGLIACAVWQKYPSWKRDRVLRFVEQVDMASLEAVGAVDDEEVVPDPPADGGAHESLNGSASSNGDGGDLVTHPRMPGEPISAGSTD